MDASHFTDGIACPIMTTRGRRELGPYIEITADFQRDVSKALGDNTYKWLGEQAGVDPSSISLMMDPSRVGKTSRIITRVASVLRIPLPRSETDLDGKKLARLKAENPNKYRLVHDLITALYGNDE